MRRSARRRRRAAAKAAASRAAGRSRRQRRPLARQSRSRRPSCRARCSTRRAPRRKPGTSRSTSPSRGLDYTVGDAFGLFPPNDPALVDAVIRALDAPADFPIGGRTLREVLIDGVSLSPAPDMLFQLFSYLTGGERRKKAKALAAGEDPDGDAATLDVLGRDREVPRRPARPGSLHRGARSAAAAALFDLVVAEGAIPAACR